MSTTETPAVLPRIAEAPTLPAALLELHSQAHSWLNGLLRVGSAEESDFLSAITELGEAPKQLGEVEVTPFIVKDVTRKSSERQALMAIVSGRTGMFEGPELDPIRFAGRRDRPDFSRLLRGLSRLGFEVLGVVHPVGSDALQIVWRTFFRHEE